MSQRRLFRVALVMGMWLAVGPWSAAPAVGSPLGGPAEQAGSAPQVAINQLDFSNYPKLKLVVTVTSTDGRPLRGLSASAFGVTEDGRTITATSVESVDASPNVAPIRIALAMDTSDSMKGGAIEEAKAAAAKFVQDLDPRDKVALFTFNRDVIEVQPFTNNKIVLSNAIAGLTTAPGGTALYEAIYRAAEAVEAEKKVCEQTPTLTGCRSAFVVLTDGWNDSALTRTLDAAIDRAKASGAPGYLLGFGTAREQDLAKVAAATNGRYMKKPTAGDVGALFADLTGLLSSQYVVTYDTAVTADDKSHDFTVRVNSDGGTGTNTKSLVITDKTFSNGGRLPPATAAATPTATPVSIQDPPPVPGPVGDCDWCLQIDAAGGCACCDADRDGKCDGPTGIPLWFWVLLIAILLLLALLGAIFIARRPTASPEQYSNTDDWYTPPSGERTGAIQPQHTHAPMPVGIPPVQQTVVLRKPAQAMAWLVVADGPLASRQFPLVAGGDTGIGRAADNGIILEGEGTVSRYHAKVRHQGNDFVLHDMGATNGSKVNGQPITRQRLVDGDRVEIGNVKLVFKRVS